ncbi:MAG: PLP-dependent aminotransferase family protein [Oscillospiraceae bacterium]|nr:PLP-dependent aminotransferase family protein [Oscillospiraceae bacterium]MBQ8780721.1 PLP-dependent aminotransferase family protein [Oscillospiraceae bacterium]
MFTLTFNSDDKTPLYQQLCSYIKSEIESGGIKSGERLPSKRVLSAHLKISIITVETAYAQLMAEGYITSKPGSGYYAECLAGDNAVVDVIAEDNAAQTDPAEIKYDFRTNRIDTSDFPFSVWAKLSREVLSERSSDLLNACPSQGMMPLRMEIAEYLKSFRGMNVNPEQIFVGAGSEYLMGLIIQLLGRDNAYGVENPGYNKIYRIFSANTSRVFPVPMDEKGASAEAISGFGINVLHITPSHHFPLGMIMPVSRRQELLRWAYSCEDRYIIEDDYDSEFRYSGRPVPTLQSMDKNGRVIYINTFTKSLAPSMRISYMILPQRLCERYNSRLSFYSCTVPVFEQLTLAKFMENGHFERHINRMKKIYRQRRDILCKKITEGSLGEFTEISGTDAGMHLLLTVNNGMKQSELISSAANEGAMVHGLSEYYAFPVSDMPKNTVVAGFSGLNEQQLILGAEAFERAWTK